MDAHIIFCFISQVVALFGAMSKDRYSVLIPKILLHWESQRLTFRYLFLEAESQTISPGFYCVCLRMRYKMNYVPFTWWAESHLEPASRTCWRQGCFLKATPLWHSSDLFKKAVGHCHWFWIHTPNLSLEGSHIWLFYLKVSMTVVLPPFPCCLF